MKKYVIVPALSVLWVLILTFAACERPNRVENPYDRGLPTNLPEQHFTSALDAYNFAKKYFEEDATFYENTHFGSATPAGIGGAISGTQLNYSRKNLTANGDFLYEMANYSDKKPLGVDTNFAFIAAAKARESGYRYARVNGDSHIVRDGLILRSDFSGQNYDSLTPLSASEFESMSGMNPRLMTNYIINSATVISSTAPQRVDNLRLNGYKFSMTLNEGSFENYKKQITYAGGQEFRSFDSLSLEFSVDIYGRMVAIEITEKYSVTAMGTKQTIDVLGNIYFTYDKSATIDFDTLTATYPAQ